MDFDREDRAIFYGINIPCDIMIFQGFDGGFTALWGV